MNAAKLENKLLILSKSKLVLNDSSSKYSFFLFGSNFFTFLSNIYSGPYSTLSDSKRVNAIQVLLLIPTTGMTLPFLSYGGSSLIGSSIIAGVILNLTRKDASRY